MGLGQTIRKAVTSLVPRSRKNEPKDSLAGKSSSPDEHGRREQDESTNAIPNPKESNQRSRNRLTKVRKPDPRGQSSYIEPATSGPSLARSVSAKSIPVSQRVDTPRTASMSKTNAQNASSNDESEDKGRSIDGYNNSPPPPDIQTIVETAACHPLIEDPVLVVPREMPEGFPTFLSGNPQISGQLSQWSFSSPSLSKTRLAAPQPVRYPSFMSLYSDPGHDTSQVPPKASRRYNVDSLAGRPDLDLQPDPEPKQDTEGLQDQFLEPERSDEEFLGPSGPSEPTSVDIPPDWPLKDSVKWKGKAPVREVSPSITPSKDQLRDSMRRNMEQLSQSPQSSYPRPVSLERMMMEAGHPAPVLPSFPGPSNSMSSMQPGSSSNSRGVIIKSGYPIPDYTAHPSSRRENPKLRLQRLRRGGTSLRSVDSHITSSPLPSGQCSPISAPGALWDRTPLNGIASDFAPPRPSGEYGFLKAPGLSASRSGTMTPEEHEALGAKNESTIGSHCANSARTGLPKWGHKEVQRRRKEKLAKGKNEVPPTAPTTTEP